MLEKDVEGYLRKQIEKLGGECYKWVSPGNSGVPDRIILLPQGRLIFVETKKPGEKARALQKYFHKHLRKLGFDVRVIDTIEGVDQFIDEIRS